MDELPSERFISGVYNYCDRWCERCRFNDRCLVYHEERRRAERHLLDGRDPNDMDVVIEGVQESFAEAFGRLQEMAEEEGIDLEAAMADEDEEEELDEGGLGFKRARDHPLHHRVERWSERVGVLLDLVRAEMGDQGQEVLARLKDGRIPDPEEAVAALTGLRDACELLVRYRFFVVVKAARALGGWGKAEGAPDELIRDARLSDSFGTAKLVHACLGEAAGDLWLIGEFSQPWMEMAMPIAMETESLRQAIDTEFPGHQQFHRPGFDDEPE